LPAAKKGLKNGEAQQNFGPSYFVRALVLFIHLDSQKTFFLALPSVYIPESKGLKHFVVELRISLNLLQIGCLLICLVSFREKGLL
jgi:hypothetical protein